MEVKWPTSESILPYPVRMVRKTESLPDCASLSAAEFCIQRGIEADRDSLKGLMLKHIPGPIEVVFRVEVDPESEGTWLTAEAAGADPALALESYNRLLREWIDTTSPATREHFRITFSFA